jgi:hypothetical protein
VELIAEELFAALLEDIRRGETTCATIADKLTLEHLFCDPDFTQRAALCVRGPQEIQLDEVLGRITTAQADAENKRAFRIREHFWLDAIERTGAKRVLLVCGANHVHGVTRRARARGWSATLVERDWPES